jgi:hypothetical protein
MSEGRIRLRQLERQRPKWGFDKAVEGPKLDNRMGTTGSDLLTQDGNLSGLGESSVLRSKHKLTDSMQDCIKSHTELAKDVMESPAVHPSSPEDTGSDFIVNKAPSISDCSEPDLPDVHRQNSTDPPKSLSTKLK